MEDLRSDTSRDSSKPDLPENASKSGSSLGFVIALRIVSIFLLFGIAQYFVIKAIALWQFNALEHTNLLERTHQAYVSFNREASNLRGLTASNAAWDETYNYVVKPDPKYPERNYGGSWPKLYNIDFVLIIALDGRRIWSSEGSPSFPAKGPSLFATDRFLPNNPYLFPSEKPYKPNDFLVGVIGSEQNAWLYCSHVITNDNLTAEPRGFLVVGRSIDKEMLSSFTVGEKDELLLIPPGLAPPPSKSDNVTLVAPYALFNSKRTATQVEETNLVSYTPLFDKLGSPVAALKLSIPRTIQQAGNRVVWGMSASLLIIAIICLGVVLITIRASVVNPVSRLAAFVTAHIDGRDTILNVSKNRRDEIGILAVKVAFLIEKVKEQHAELEKLANTDRLTGLANRRALEAHVQREYRRLLRLQRDGVKNCHLAVVVLDVDHFKLFNDTNGHMAGDVCLKAVAETILSCFSRPGDLACRFGGEEFILILPDTNEAGAMVVAESVRAAIQGVAIPHTTSPVAKVATVSAGVAAVEVTDQFRFDALIKKADEALYAAKKAGRNRVISGSSLV